MILKFREPSVRLENGTLSSDEISSRIFNEIGVRKMAKLVGKSPTTISRFAHGELALPLSVVLNIANECGMENSVWVGTLYARIEAAERIGFTFNKNKCDQVKPEVFHA